MPVGPVIWLPVVEVNVYGVVDAFTMMPNGASAPVRTIEVFAPPSGNVTVSPLKKTSGAGVVSFQLTAPLIFQAVLAAPVQVRLLTPVKSTVMAEPVLVTTGATR